LTTNSIHVEISYRLTEKDFIKFNFYSNYSKPMSLYFTILSLWLGYVAVSKLLSGEFPITDYRMFLFLFMLIITLVIPFATYFSSKKVFANDPFLKSNITFDYNDEGFHIYGEKFSSQLEWETVVKTKESKNYFLIYTTKRSAYIIPQYQLEKEDIEDLKRTLIAQTKLSKRRVF